MREGKIEITVCAYAALLGWLVYKFTSPGHRGVPDHIFMKNGKLIFIEFKSTQGKLTPMQRIRISEIEHAGFSVHIINDIELGKAVFDAHT